MDEDTGTLGEMDEHGNFTRSEPPAYTATLPSDRTDMLTPDYKSPEVDPSTGLPD